MKYEDRPTAFIAMRFSDDHWRDKTYLAIREELEAGGYQVIRGDELKSSGPVVDEVCRLLKEADFVVIDSSGDSHNVSYELGYCHGINRDPEQTLLLRNDHHLPFNYRHYRHRVYKDIRHLRRLLRDFLSIYEPLSDDMYGYTFTFEFSESIGMGYIVNGAEFIINALLETQMTGRCELFSAEQFSIPGRFFTIGVMMRLRGKTNVPDYEAWLNIAGRVSELCKQSNGTINLVHDMSELSDKHTMNKCLIYCGAAQIEDGRIYKLLDIDEEGNFFESYFNRKQSDKK
ncbi:hypothetical protein [Rubinisphaera sp.]|uniref:hypothetical protein n=1 Tax=Rubinisphaera sp. TaxID=2024857 RepID=UPI000EE73EBA|nr:hypothetical protein [Rubinisphaera sp.]HCS54546.1 hypothetical protein [Planctomycetaceae bacterium]|tara:strand:- start:247 stop:1107 length:861 start_codon:yes stop_codon:yes gene_type:complete